MAAMRIIPTPDIPASEPVPLPAGLQQLRLWQLISPTLPIGAFAYSQAQEYAVHAGWISDERTAGNWIGALLNEVLAVTEAPVFARCYAAARQSDWKEFQRWNDVLLAMREAAELQQEDLHLGGALVRVMPNLGLEWPAVLHDRPFGYIATFAYACSRWEIDAATAAQALLWTWCENQVAAAIKLVPLGQSAGQRLLLQLADAIPDCVCRGWQCDDADIGMIAPGFAMASAWHETQYTRLFRS